MRVLLIYNPAAGRSRQAGQLAGAIALMEDAGWIVEPAHTQAPDHAEHLAEQAAADGFQAVVVVGGDGTVNQVVNGLMAAHEAGAASVALGLLPGGTANVLARDLGLPVPGPGRTATVLEAAQLLLQSSVESVDLGLVRNARGTRYFTCWAGVGVDAAVTAHVEANPQVKRRIGPLFFAASAALHARQLVNAPHYTIRMGDHTWRGQGILVVISNIKHYAILFDMAPRASLNDGLLDLAFFRSGSVINMAKTLWLLRTGQHIAEHDVTAARIEQVEIDAERSQPVHLDAEPFGTTPITVGVKPRSLRLLVPPLPKAQGLVSAR